MSAEQTPTEEDRVFIRMMIDNGLQDAWPAENLTNADFHDTITVFARQGLVYFLLAVPYFRRPFLNALFQMKIQFEMWRANVTEKD